MRFSIKLTTAGREIPINYQYPLSAAIYKILNKADEDYAEFLHEKGYGKGFKFFCFSDLRGKFRADGDRLQLLSDTISFEISFHLPEASQNFIKGLFLSQKIEIADKKSKPSFVVQSVKAMPNPFEAKKDNDILSFGLQPASPCVVGIKNERGNYDFLSPEDTRFTESLIYNWRNKIEACYDEETATSALLMAEIIPMKNPPKSRLMTIKAGTAAETKIRGWLNFELKVTGEKRFVKLLWNSGAGVYNSMGCGMVEAIV